jgi:hypothetical protein
MHRATLTTCSILLILGPSAQSTALADSTGKEALKKKLMTECQVLSVQSPTLKGAEQGRVRKLHCTLPRLAGWKGVLNGWER